jgi:flagellar capping protein FliD
MGHIEDKMDQSETKLNEKIDAVHELVKSLSTGTTEAIWDLKKELGKVSEDAKKPIDIL